MRAKRNIGKRFSFLLIASLLVCFSLVMAVTFIGTTDRANIGTDNIADAKEKDFGMTASALDLTTNYSESAIGFRKNISENEYIITTDLRQVSWNGTSNCSFFENGSAFLDFGQLLDYKITNNKGTFKCEATAALSGLNQDTFNLWFCVGFDIGAYVSTILNNYGSKYSISANLDWSADGIDSTYLQLKSNLSMMPNASYKANDITGFSYSSGYSKSIDITGTNSRYMFLFIDVQGDASDGNGKTPTVSFHISSLSISIKQNRIENDYGNPIVTSSLSNLSSALVSGSDTDKMTTIAGNTAVPCYNNITDLPNYDELLQDYLVADSYANGSGSLISYTNSSIGTISTKPYYKYVQIEYVDTYNTYVDSGTGEYDKTSISSYLSQINASSSAQSPNQTIIDGYKNRIANNLGAGDKCLVNSTTTDANLVSSNNYFDIIENSNYVGTLVNYDNLGWNTRTGKCSGIKAIQIGETQFWVMDSAAIGQEISININGVSTVVGYAYVRAISGSTAYDGKVVVAIYMYQSADIDIEVADYGNGYTTSTIVFSGIDTTAPTMSPTFSAEDDVIDVESASITKWAKAEVLTVSVSNSAPASQESDGSDSPYMWFFTVTKNNSSFPSQAAISYNSYAQIKAAGLKPIAVSKFESFRYDFVSGSAVDADGILIGDLKGVVGSGYYLFTFYTLDLAGNFRTSQKEFYVKVDLETPYSSLSVVADSKNITNANNGYWSNNGYSIAIELLKNNISGNTLQFSTTNIDYYLVLDQSKMISIIGDKNVVTPINAFSYSGLTIKGSSQSSNISISTDSNGSMGTIITISIPSSELFAWETHFTMYVGQTVISDMTSTANIVPVSFDAPSFIQNTTSYPGINFSNDLKIYVDNAIPKNPLADYSENSSVLQSVNSSDLSAANSALELLNNLQADRVWFSEGGLKLNSTINFNDMVLGTDFADGLKLYYGVKSITGNFKSITDFITAYNNASSTPSNYATYFDRTAVFNGDSLDESATDIEIDLRQDLSSNMRIIALWAEDQAGHKTSSVQLYYVLADPTQYTIKSSIYANAILGTTATIGITDIDETPKATYRRGEGIVISCSLDEGYVPYLLERKGASTKTIVSNSSATIAWDINNSLFSSLISDYSIDDNVIKFTFNFDDPTTLGSLDSTTTFEFSHRKVVGYTITNKSIRYTSKTVEIPISYTDDRTVNVYKFAYQDNGGTSITPPIIPGKYKVKVYIDANDHSFVSNDVDTVDFESFEIVNGIATIKAVATSSYYSKSPKLDYDVEGIDAATVKYLQGLGTSVFDGSLKLNVSETDYTKLSVGSYAIVEKTPFKIQYYNVTFEGSYHKIEQLPIKINILNGQKEYGDADTDYEYTVDTNQVGGINKLKSILGIKNDGSYSYDDITKLGTFKTNTFISREAGEAVNKYEYIATPKSFALQDENYIIQIEDQGVYEITKKTIILDASGQSYMLASSADYTKENLESIIPYYSLGKNSQYQSLIKGNLALNVDPIISASEGSGEGYSAKYTYKIIKGTILDTDDIAFVLKTDSNADDMVIYIAPSSTVVVSLKSNVRIEHIYGQVWSDDILKYDETKFNVYIPSSLESSANGYDDIKWKATNAVLQTPSSYANVGTYKVDVSEAFLYKQGSPISLVKVIVTSFPVYVVPAEIVIEPVAKVNNKIYAESDDLYSIGSNIVSIAGKAVKENDFYGGTQVSAINTAYINGLFARALYDENNLFIAFGSKNDSASDMNGIVFNSSNYYSFAVFKQFTSIEANGNYTVKVQLDLTNRLEIKPARINIDIDDFVGISKVYDGTDNVKYSNGAKAVDLNAELKVKTDDVELSFIANYISTDGKANAAVGKKYIHFTSLGLVGNQSSNYVLWYKGLEATNATTVDVYYITYVGQESIEIIDGKINVLRSDFVISKEYDNLTTLTKDAISIINRTDENNKGTAILYGAKDSMQVLYGEYPDKEVSNGYSVDILLFFPLGSDATEDGIFIDQSDTTIQVTKERINDVLGIKVYITGINATITKKVLKADDFESVKAVDRDYNATDAITFEYVLKASALAEGDNLTIANSSITLNGYTKDNQVNVGKYDAIFKDYSISNSTFGSHYEVSISSLNNKYSSLNQLQVNIDYAKLIPRVEFISREYNGSWFVEDSKYLVEVNDKASSTTSQLTTINYAEALINELKNFEYVFSDVKYYYSKNGKNDGNVQVDENGNVVLHNIKITGLTITENDHLKEATTYTSATIYYDDTKTPISSIVDEASFNAYIIDKKAYTLENGLLSNYRVYGSKYDSTSNKYVEVGAIVSGTEIPAYEAFNMAGLTPAALVVKNNDIEVSNKVYDGTKLADINASLASSNAVENDKEYLSVIATATYSRKQIGDGISVTVKVSKLELNELHIKDDLKKDPKDYEYLLNNYKLTTFTDKIYRNIKAKPVAFTVSFEKRYYNGEEAITKNLIKYDLSKMDASNQLNGESKYYSVNTEYSAYYFDKDVAYSEYTKVKDGDKFNGALSYYTLNAGVYSPITIKNETEFNAAFASGLYYYEINEIEKVGTAYNPILYNSKEKYVNYKLSIMSETPIEGAINEKDFYAYELNDGTIFYGNSCRHITTSTSTFDATKKYYSLSYALQNLTSETFDAQKDTVQWYYFDSNVKCFYYDLPTTNKYITVANYLANSTNKDTMDKYIVGFYIYNNVDVYVLDNAINDVSNASDLAKFDGKIQDLSYTLTYVQGKGIIERREISVTGVTKDPDSKAYEKVYDGTTRFAGKQGIDYFFGSNAINNDIEADNLDVSKVSAAFKYAQAGISQVVFKAEELTATPTSNIYNYKSSSNTSTNKQGNILKRTIYAYLADADMIYGSSIGEIEGTISYYLDEDCTKEIILRTVYDKDGKATGTEWYAKYDDFKSVCFGTLVLDNENQEQLNARRYTTSYVADPNGEYYKLAGSFTEPTVDIEVEGSKQAVGYEAKKYGLKGGNATNFTFAFKYSNTKKTDKDGNPTIDNAYSLLKVVKRTIYIIADATKEYSRVYGTDLNADAVKILLLDENGDDGIVSGETSSDVYTGSLKVVFKLIYKDDLANIASAEKVTAKSLINKTVGGNIGLDDGYFYVAYIEQSAGFGSKNYDVKFGSIMYNVINDNFYYSLPGYIDAAPKTPMLTIVLPTIEDVALTSETKSVTYNKSNQANSIVSGLMEGDDVMIYEEDENGTYVFADITDDNVENQEFVTYSSYQQYIIANSLELDEHIQKYNQIKSATDVRVNANGEVIPYEGLFVVTRKLLKNEKTTYVIWKIVGRASLTINKASAGLKAKDETVVYDKKYHQVSADCYGVTDTGIGVNANDYRVEYTYNGKPIDKTLISNAGTYTYKVILSSPTHNYMDEEKTAQFIIVPATINVTVDKTKLTQEYIAGKAYTINYSIEDVMNIGVELSDTLFKFYKGDKVVKITNSGRYTYVIGLTDDKANELGNNVTFINNSGYLDLTVSEISSFLSEDEKVATLKLKNAGDSLLVDSYETRYLEASNATAEDDMYWVSVNQYMSTISNKIGAGAQLVSIVRMNLMYGSNSQSLNGKEAMVDLSLPENVDQSLKGYAVYATTSAGGLVQLKPSEYTIKDGIISYSTSYLGSLVFVKLGDQGLPTAAKIGIGVGVAVLILTIAGGVAITILKKKKLNAIV